MEFVKIEYGKIFLCTDLKICENCGKYMVSRYECKDIYKVARFHNIELQSYQEEETICVKCSDSGIYKKECLVCENKHEYPKDFAIELVYYPQYPEECTERSYICAGCIDNRSKEVIKEMLSASTANSIRAK
jgi:hypothetical protein